MIKKFLLFLGILVIVFILGTGLTIVSVLFGKAQKCPLSSGPVRSDAELLRLLETRGLTISNVEATSLIQKPLSSKVDNARICFTEGLVHLSGNFKAGNITPSFYVSTGVDVSGFTPKTKNLDIRIGSLPNLFIFTPIEKMIEGMINDNLSQMKLEEKISVEFTSGAATIKKVK